MTSPAVPSPERASTTEVADIARLTGARRPAIPPLARFTASAVLARRRTEVRPMPTDAPRRSADVPRKPPTSSLLADTFRDADRNPRYAWTNRRRNRLVLVAMQAAVLLAVCGLLANERPVPALLVGLAFFPLTSLVNIGIHGLFDVPVAHLDEVMVRVRNEAKARAHTVLVVLLGVLLALTPSGARFAGEQFQDDAVAVTLVASSVAGLLFFVAMLLPTWILAWRLPDDAADDVEVSAHTGTEPREHTDG